MKRTVGIGLVLIVVLFSTQLVMAGGQADETKAEIVTVRMLMPGDESQAFREVLAATLNPKLREDIQIELEITWIPWDQYWEKMHLMFASGEPVDLCWTTAGRLPSEVESRFVMPLGDLLDEYAPDLLEVIPRQNFKVFEFDGEEMAIPSANAPSSSAVYTVMYRGDLREAVGIEEKLTSIADLENYLSKVQQEFPDAAHISAYPILPAFLREEPGHITYLTGEPYRAAYVDDSESGDQVYSYYESELFENYCRTMRRWNLRGFVPEDLLARPDAQSRMATGTSIMNNGCLTRFYEGHNALVANIPGGWYEDTLINPTQQRYIMNAGNEAYIIYSQAPHPEEAMKFLNWIFKSQENYDLAIYGVEDQQYSLDAEGRVAFLTTDELFYEWMFRNMRYMRFAEWMDPEIINTLKTWDDSAEYSKIFGFNFNLTPVSSEVAQFQTVLTEYLTPMMWGFTDYDEVYPTALEKMQAAGLDSIMAELQRQFSAHLARRE